MVPGVRQADPPRSRHGTTLLTQLELSSLGSAAKPPVFEKSPPAYLGRQSFDAPGFDMSGFCGGSATFWWCFQLCDFDQQGFCSRTNFTDLTPLPHAIDSPSSTD